MRYAAISWRQRSMGGFVPICGVHCMMNPIQQFSNGKLGEPSEHRMVRRITIGRKGHGVDDFLDTTTREMMLGK